MKEIKDIANFRDLHQLESEPSIFYDEKEDTIIITRPHEKTESMEEYIENHSIERIVDVYIDENTTNWYVIIFTIKRKDYVKTQKEVLKELEG